LQLGPNIGEMNFWYKRISPMTASAGSRTSVCSQVIVGLSPVADPRRSSSSRRWPAGPAPRRSPRRDPATSRPARAGPGVADGAAAPSHRSSGRPPPRPAEWGSPAGSAPRSRPTVPDGRGGWWHAPANGGAAGGGGAARSDRQAGAAFAAAGRQDRTTGTGAHPQSEAVLLVTSPIVRLVRALHDVLPRAMTLGSVELAPIDNRRRRRRFTTRASPKKHTARRSLRPHPDAPYTATRRPDSPTRRPGRNP
jgi:hypothetical protein